MRPIVQQGTSWIDTHANSRHQRRRYLARQTAVVLAWAGLLAAALIAVAGAVLLADHWHLI